MLPEYRPLSFPPSPLEPNGALGLLGSKGPGNQQREAEGQEMGDKVCVACYPICRCDLWCEHILI